MSFASRFVRLFRRPPREVAKRIEAYMVRQTKAFWLRSRDCFLPSFPRRVDVPVQPLISHIPKFSSEDLRPWREALGVTSAHILEHRFDLLGSGSVIPGLDFDAPGFDGHRYFSQHSDGASHVNLADVRRLRAHISADYQPIDWHLDFRSGYRWPANVPSSRIVYGQLPGVDIKLPWELSRMQHLPVLALAFAELKGRGGDPGTKCLVREFQDEVFDFLASNPPRFGVNWACTMDVAIRVTNMLIAYDIFLSAGCFFSSEFEFEFKRAVWAHGRHIVSNLEWFDELCSNHYLSNIAGLFFVAAYLPPTPETNGWLALAANELGKEIFQQFQSDGSNFEGSTSYHRLSAEMVIFSVALGHRISARLSQLDWDSCLKGVRTDGPGMLPKAREIRARHAIDSLQVVQRIAEICSFSRAITRPDGKIVQIGDNDSGRFVRLTPGIRLHDNEGCSHDTLIDSADALCKPNNSSPATIDGLLVARLTERREVVGMLVPAAAPQNFLRFDDFGLYIMRSARIWLAVRCGQVGQRGNGGHAHNDQLSLELCVDGRPFLVDPGTYVYTPSPDMRNYFRSTCSHSTLTAGTGEQNGWLAGREGLFSMSRIAKAQVVEASGQRFVGEHDGFELPHRRSIILNGDCCEVIDECTAAARVLHFSLAPGVEVRPFDGGVGLTHGPVSCLLEIPIGVIELLDAWFSPGYGRKVKTRRIQVHDLPERCLWKFSTVPLQDA